jgi:hypothetical protein
MRRLRAVVAVALVPLLLAGCTAIDARAMKHFAVVSCTDQDPDPDPTPDPGDTYVPPVDHPMMFAEVRVTNDGTERHEYDIRSDIYTRAGKKVGGADGYIQGVEPGETVSGTLIGEMSIAMPPEGVECRITYLHVVSDPFDHDTATPSPTPSP